MRNEILDYYGKPGEITNLDRYKSFIEWIPDDPGAIYQIVQGLIVHDMWVGQYGLNYDVSHEYPQKTAYMADLLDKALELDGSSLALPRHPRDRVIACCREFATLMCAILRAKGIPARSRCGFAVYFGWNGVFEDHWVCEYWNGSGWTTADPQLDPFQQSSIQSRSLNANRDSAEKQARIRQFDPRSLKQDEFITGGQAWKLCREGKEDPGKFGISCPIQPDWGIDSLYGLWFIRGQLLRDFASLNKVETVPYLVRICKKLDWKPWRLVGSKDEEISQDDLKLLDAIAELSLDPDTNFAQIRETYTMTDDLAVPGVIISRW